VQSYAVLTDKEAVVLWYWSDGLGSVPVTSWIRS